MKNFRYWAKLFLHSLLYLSGKPCRNQALMRNKLTVITYHSFSQSNANGLHTCLPVAAFRNHLKFLRKNFLLVHLEEGVERLAIGAPQQRPMISITIDDGFADNYTYAFPLLQAYQIPATIFLATDFLDTEVPPWPTELIHLLDQTTSKELSHPVPLPLTSWKEKERALLLLMQTLTPLPPDKRSEFLATIRRELAVPACSKGPSPLRWEQVRKMRDSNIKFGSHTVFHSILTEMEQKIIHEELALSKKRIEEELSEQCLLFAYPNGNHNECTRKLLKDIGYQIGLTQDFGTNGTCIDHLAMQRVEIPFHDPLPTFACRASIALAPAGQSLPNLHH